MVALRSGEPPDLDTPALVFVDGWGINIANPEMCSAKVMAAAKALQPNFTVTLNLDHLAQLRRNPQFVDAYSAANFVTADGAPISMLAALQGAAIERTTGADLVLPLCKAAAKEQLGVFLFGSTAEVLDAASRRLMTATDGQLVIAGCEAPPYGFDPKSAEADAMIDRIQASGARICLVALGAPKQEIFAARATSRGVPVTFVCIGAALDFLAGSKQRAPRIMQRSGLEWLWRVCQEPRRLSGRYARCALVLADIVLSGPSRSPKDRKTRRN